MPVTLDHLVFVVDSLDEAINDFEDLTGVRPAVGGRHEKFGTHNALVRLGNGSYLEFLARDPEAAAEVADTPWLGVDGPKPRLSTWCCDVGCDDGVLDGLVAHLRECDTPDLFSTEISAMSRTKPDGSILSWRLAADRHLVPTAELPMSGLVPFLIDWGAARDVRPGLNAPEGCELVALRVYHPRPNEVIDALEHMGAHGLVIVEEDSVQRLVAILRTKRGEEVELS
eukprot:TRINITY_DN21131_c0_g1_i1.p1 TRINITY_DN21131_c0_g1~~TRINITY_DN21131_c0_g1_i1.p1  ORF type:complete len:227 (+),score=25.51 TRINITY_DN21131_c0_g1_i1:68-748(+)